MTGFVNTVNGFSQSAIDALVVRADDLYISEIPPSDWTPRPLPAGIDVTSQAVMDGYGLTAVPQGTVSGGSDGTTALRAIAADTRITNWYIPTGTTVRLQRIEIPTHVTTIFGGGNIVSIHAQTYTGVSLYPTTGCEVVFDGLTFLVDTASDYPTEGEDVNARYRSHIYISQLQSTTYTEIRNCVFNGLGRYSDLVTVRASDTNYPTYKHTNVKIYNNNFLQAEHFAMEIGIMHKTEELQSDSWDGLDGLEIFNNYFEGASGGHGGLSIVRVRSGSSVKIYNNSFDTCVWGIELAQCNAIDFYNNQITGSSVHPITSYGPLIGAAYTDDYLPTGQNFIHHNHIEAGIGNQYDWPYIYTYSGCKDEYYENFLNTNIRWKYTLTSSTDPYYGGDIHDNTIVGDGTNAWIVGYDASEVGGVDLQDVTFSNNEVYGQYASSQTAIKIASEATNVTLSDNDIKLANGGACFDNFSQTDGSCDLSYSDAIPTDRAGAGLSDPANIGPQ